MKRDNGYTIGEVSRMTGLTIRTLRYYDEIGLLCPRRLPHSAYRIYYQEQLRDLQQVLFFRALSFPLEKIAAFLSDPSFSRLEAMAEQKARLEEKLEKMKEMMDTLRAAIEEEKGEREMKDSERFRGFEMNDPYESEARERWGDEAVDSAQGAIRRKGSGVFASEMKAVFTSLAEVRMSSPSSEAAQTRIGQWYDLLNTIQPYTLEMFASLGRLYLEDERFQKNIDRYGEGLASFMASAMEIYANS